ncbi:hypothetical protein HPB47_015750 [Ixodes persulcatus]|uniref:Uncharacterized protein n=1 Tax=Ixodes persulcatus TaxID=34615 RepID=A0AC60QSL8_IXOPE|nr:hypothetical protein HPB47_015750 [Ixodes persulcatus]
MLGDALKVRPGGSFPSSLSSRDTRATKERTRDILPPQQLCGPGSSFNIVSCDNRSNLWTVPNGGREHRRPGLRGGGTGVPPGGGPPTAVALIQATTVGTGCGSTPVSGSLPPTTAQRHPSADSRQDGRHGVREQPRTTARSRATSRTPSLSSLDTPSPGTGAAPLPTTKSTHHVATWTWQQGTGAATLLRLLAGMVGPAAAQRGVPGDKLPPLFRGRKVRDADREGQGASMTPDPAAVYCEGCGVLRIHEIHEESKIHLIRVRVPEVVPPHAPPELHDTLDQPGRRGRCRAVVHGATAGVRGRHPGRQPLQDAHGRGDGRVSGDAAPSAPVPSPEEERQLTEELLQF